VQPGHPVRRVLQAGDRVTRVDVWMKPTYDLGQALSSGGIPRIRIPTAFLRNLTNEQLWIYASAPGCIPSYRLVCLTFGWHG
jgi:hypothetical protein